jgi:O-antigen/teichoic acid export membrane protein
MKISPEDFRQRLLPIVSAQVVGLACGVVGVRLTSQLVDPTDYGLYGIFVSLATIGATVIYVGLVKFVSRHWQGTADRAGLVREILAAMLRKTPWLVAAAAGAALWIAPAEKLSFGALLFASAFLLTLTQLAQSAMQAAREHWRDFGLSCGVSVTRSFAPPLLYAATGAGLTALLSGFLLQAFTGALLGAWTMRRWWRAAAPSEKRAATLTAVYDGPRFVTLAVAGWILVGLNRWLVAWFFGTEMAGYFTLAGNIGTILPSMLGMVMLQYYQPLWFAGPTDDEPSRRRLLRDVDKVALVYTLLAVTLALALSGSMPLLIGPLVSPKYLPAAEFVLVAGCSTVSITTGLFFHAMLLAARRERDCSTVDLSGAAILVMGGLVSAAAGLTWFKGWLVVSPVVPWLVNRPLARRSILRPA